MRLWLPLRVQLTPTSPSLKLLPLVCLLSGIPREIIGQTATRVSATKNEDNQWLDDISESRRFGKSQLRSTQAAGRKLSSPTSEMIKLRPILDRFSTQTSLLKSELTKEVSRNPPVRAVLSDAYSLSADAVLLSRDAKAENDHLALRSELEQLDAGWGELAHRLATQRNLSKETQQLTTNVTNTAKELRAALDIRPQINYHAVSSKAVSLATDLEYLLDDIQLNARRVPDSRQLQIATGKARQQILLLADRSDERANVDSLVVIYRQFRESWYPQASKLQAQQTSSFTQSLRRVAQHDAELARLLLLQDRYDKTQITYLATALRKEISGFFYYATLDQLLKLPRSQQAFATADELYGQCENFVDEVNSSASYQDVVTAFRYLEQAERSFQSVFGPIDDIDASAALERITQTLITLRTSLQVEAHEVNRQALTSVAARIASITEQMDATTRKWLSQDRQSFADACLKETAALKQAALQLENRVNERSPSLATLRQESDQLYQRWKTVYNYLIKCQTADRPALGQLSSRLTPSLVELKTLLTP